MFNTYRDKYYLFFLLIPNFADIDFAVRNSLIIKFWIHCVKRGKAIVMCSIDNPVAKDAWNMKQLYLNFERGNIMKIKNLFCILQWKDVSPRIYRQYQKIKARKRAEAHGLKQTGKREFTEVG